METEIEDELQKEQQRLLGLAEACADRFWDAHFDHKSDPKTRGRLGLRVRK